MNAPHTTAIVETEYDPVRDHQIYQALILGATPYDAAIHFGVPLEYVLPIRDELPEFMRKRSVAPAVRKQIALARTDMAMASLMPAVEKGDREAINLMLKVQKREAAMTGLDAPTKTDSELTIRVDAPWLSPDRLSYMYKPGAEVIDLTPLGDLAIASQPTSWRPDEDRVRPTVPDFACEPMKKPHPNVVANPSELGAKPKP